MKKIITFSCIILGLQYCANAQTQLWGVSEYGGIHGAGTIFMADGDGNNLHTVYSFDSINGSIPLGGLTLADNGKLYGFTLLGGFSNSCVLFCYNPITGINTNIHDFAAYPQYGQDAHSEMIKAGNGKMYGLCNGGGANNKGVIFELDTLNNYTDIFDLTDSTGSVPLGSLINANNGLMYGMTSEGGANNIGTIFSFDITTSTFAKLYDFNSATGQPNYGYLGLMQASNGKLYGMTQMGGANNFGVIFSFDIGTNIYTDIHDFDNIQGAAPDGTLVESINGWLWGMTQQGGTGDGIIFRFLIYGSTFNQELAFNGINGSQPRRGLKLMSDGNLFGTTYQGGTNNRGVAFRFNLYPSYSFTKIIDFDASTTGVNPDCNFIETPVLIQCSNGTTLNINSTSCTGYTLNSQTYYTSGTYIQMLTNVRGCDSVVTLNLSFGTAPVITVNSASICLGQSDTLTANGATSYSWSAGAIPLGINTAIVTPSVTTTYTVTGTAATGCAIAVSTINVHPFPAIPYIMPSSYSSCEGDSISWEIQFNGIPNEIYSWAGPGSNGIFLTDSIWTIPFTDTLMNGIYNVTATLNGCTSKADSFSVHFIQKPVVSPINLSQTICSGDTANIFPVCSPAFGWHGFEYNYCGFTEFGFTVSASSANVTGYSPPCSGCGYFSISQQLINSGTSNETVSYTVYPYNNGCDGIYNIDCAGAPVTFVVTVKPAIDITVNSNADSIISNQNNAAYQWLDCNNFNFPITGETNQFFTTSSTGNYAVAISMNGCADTSVCVFITTVGMNQFTMDNDITISPNPFTSETTITFSERQKNTTIKIMDVVGKEIKTVLFSGKSLILEKGEMQSGVYFVQITDEKKNVVNRRVVVE